MYLIDVIRSNKKHISTVFLLLISQVVAAISGILAYKNLFLSVDTIYFIGWIALYELSVIFTLGDIGFTQKYIKESSKKSEEDFRNRIEGYQILRGQIFVIAFLAFISLILYAVFFENNVDTYSIFLLSGSVFISILGYCETSELRIRRSNDVIYLSIIFANAVFLIMILSYELSIILFACFILIRSLIIYLTQVFWVGLHKIKLTKPSPGLSVVFLINLIYIFHFSVDAKILSLFWMGLEVSILLMVKKIVDSGKGLSDSLINLYSVDIANGNRYKKEAIFFISLLFIFIGIYIGFTFIGKYFFEDYPLSPLGYLSLASYYIVSILLRYLMLWMYWVDQFSIKTGLYIAFAIAAIKIIAANVSYSPTLYYQLNALGVALLLIVVYETKRKIRV